MSKFLLVGQDNGRIVALNTEYIVMVWEPDGGGARIEMDKAAWGEVEEHVDTPASFADVIAALSELGRTLA